MSVQQYWKERLLNGTPFYNEEYYNDSACCRKPSDKKVKWPKAICRSKLYLDYVVWHQAEIVPQYSELEYYKSFPEAIPQPVDEYVFYNTLSPWIYVVGKDKQVSNYRIAMQEMFNGHPITVKRYVYFVKLASLQAHTLAFELNSGMTVHGDAVAMTNIERCMELHEEVRKYTVGGASFAEIDD